MTFDEWYDQLFKETPDGPRHALHTAWQSLIRKGVHEEDVAWVFHVVASALLAGRVGDPQRGYIKDTVDEAAFALYVTQWPCHQPPTRPDGFHDEREQISWNRWRRKATAIKDRQGE